MKTRAITTLFIVTCVTTLPVQAADWQDIEGIYSVTTGHYQRDESGAVELTHYRLQLKGQSARDLYQAMAVEAVQDECTGGMAKNLQDMQCIHYLQGDTYECHFSINLTTVEIEFGVSC